MHWTQEPGFQNMPDCLDFAYQQVIGASAELASRQGSLKLAIVDVCQPEDYQHGKQVLVTTNWLAPGQLDPARYEKIPNSWCGMYAGTVVSKPVAMVKKFNCFINRMDPIRQSWLYQLVRRGVFDQGLVSFNMDISRLNRIDSTDTPHTVFERQFNQQLQIFQQEHELTRHLVPYRNFDCDLQTAIMQTEFSIVLETYFSNNNIITYTEKIFRCLKLPRPWVLFAMKDAVAHLRTMGFDVLDDLVNHSYDTVSFDIERQCAVLDQIEAMCKQTLSNNQIQRCQQAADHNQQLLLKMFDSFHADVNTACKNAVAKCLKL